MDLLQLCQNASACRGIIGRLSTEEKNLQYEKVYNNYMPIHVIALRLCTTYGEAEPCQNHRVGQREFACGIPPQKYVPVQLLGISNIQGQTSAQSHTGLDTSTILSLHYTAI